MADTSIIINRMLTVVVPVYNSSRYLRKCINSIICQRYKSLDIILINDGSTDDSGEICEYFQHIDERVRVFHQENKGLVASRKLGAELAKGKLITFVDSDDWIEPDMYINMMAVYKDYEPDLITSGITIESNNKKNYEMDKIPKGIYEKVDIKDKIISGMMYDELTQKRLITPSVWNKIYKVDLLKKAALGLDESITYGEDAAVTYIYIAMAKKIMILNNSWYHYVIHSGSMSRKYNFKSFEQIYNFYNYMKNKYLELGIWVHMEEQLKKYTKVFLKQTLQDIYDIQIDKPIYLFPYELVERGSRVIIYGAGKVGISFKDNLLKNGYAKFLGCVDKNYKSFTDANFVVKSPDILLSLETDYVVIAIESEKAAIEITNFLKQLSVEVRKIVWVPPVRLN